ncbi:putative aspartyl aminopeptidase [Cucumis melo var. makuwa]|uniref:Aspartyl aminopeptidase n=1 Tax=Cucumis melo var. makuwa TaxID=1194695 RepID=A0A5A7U018_CUCMM|nr:putative aspartyl aminopeptidase [Cucumis melo var. makuwa]
MDLANAGEVGKAPVANQVADVVSAKSSNLCPCVKLKPVSKVTKGGYLEVGVQTYGGGLWHTWFDRDLTIAGRVIVKKEKSGSVSYIHRLVRVEDPIMRIPTLAIHFDRGTDGFKVNTQSHLLPVLATRELNKAVTKNDAQNDGEKTDPKSSPNSSKHHTLLLQLLADQLNCEPDDICDFELQACDTQPSLVGGAQKEFIFSGRLDNLCMSFCSLKARNMTEALLTYLEGQVPA